MNQDVNHLSPAEKRRLLGELLLKQASIVEEFPVSLGQECILGMESQNPGTRIFLIPIVFRMHGSLDVAALRAAYDETLRRHGALRATFHAGNGTFVQRVASPTSGALEVEEMPEEGVVDPSALLHAVLQRDLRRVVDLAVGPLVRAKLFRFGPELHVLALTFHRLVTDSWSLGVFFLELKTLYAAFHEGRPSPFDSLPSQYGEYVRRQFAKADASARKRMEAFWEEKLAGLRPLRWPNDGSSADLAGDVCAVFIPHAISEAMLRLAQEAGTTPFSVALAAYFAVLHRFTGERDLWVTTPAMANRDLVETESLIGLLGNLLVLRTPVSGTTSFRRLVNDVRDVTLEAMAHQHVSVVAPARAAGTDAFGGLSGLGKTVFAYQSSPQPEFTLAGISLELVPTHAGETGSELALSVFEWGGGMAATVEYRKDLFSATVARAVGESFVQILEFGTARPDSAISEYPLSLLDRLG